MNIFYAPPEHIRGNAIELTGQEAIHASKALRYQPGDDITVVDGAGGWYEGTVHSVSTKNVRIRVQHTEKRKPVQPTVILAMGIIKKRDRLEFAVEKAVELGVQEIALFRGEHTVKQNVRMDRLEAITVSAMKQSLQCWLPDVRIYNSLEDVAEDKETSTFLIADQQGEPFEKDLLLKNSEATFVLLVGPEGGLSDREVASIKNRNSYFLKLHPNRLRTETAGVMFLSLYRGLA